MNDIARASELLTEKYRGYSWFQSVGIASDENGREFLIVYMNHKTLNRSLLVEYFHGAKVEYKVVGRVRPIAIGWTP